MGSGPRVFSSDRNNDFLSTRKWGIGPTALILKQANGLTFGFLVNSYGHLPAMKTGVNQMFLQPFSQRIGKVEARSVLIQK